MAGTPQNDKTVPYLMEAHYPGKRKCMAALARGIQCSQQIKPPMGPKWESIVFNVDPSPLPQIIFSL